MDRDTLPLWIVFADMVLFECLFLKMTNNLEQRGLVRIPFHSPHGLDPITHIAKELACKKNNKRIP